MHRCEALLVTHQVEDWVVVDRGGLYTAALIDVPKDVSADVRVVAGVVGHAHNGELVVDSRYRQKSRAP